MSVVFLVSRAHSAQSLVRKAAQTVQYIPIQEMAQAASPALLGHINRIQEQLFARMPFQELFLQ